MLTRKKNYYRYRTRVYDGDSDEIPGPDAIDWDKSIDTFEHKRVGVADTTRWITEADEKNTARCRFGTAVAAGRIQRPTTCSECGNSDGKIEGHHPDYTKPLEVIWLCHSCHTKLHTRLRKLDCVTQT